MKSVSLILAWAKIDSFIGNHSSPTLTGYRPCPICGNLDSLSFLVFDDFQFYSDSAEYPKRTQIREVQCQSCHAAYLNPCYTDTGYNYLFVEAGQSYGATEGHQRNQVNWITAKGALTEGKVFLDVGCYDGRFLSGLPNNIRRIGVDIDAPAIARGQEKYGSDGVELIHGSFESFQCPIEPDVIGMFHVLEHLANPFEVLSHLRSISHLKTQLIVEVPVLECGKTNDINGFFSIQHMTHFTIHSLGELITRAGWGVLEKQEITAYNGYRILAQPIGDSFVVVGDVGDRLKLYEYFGHWYGNLARVAKKIESWPNTSRMVIWGGGVHTEFLYQITPLFQQNFQREYLIVDSDPLKQGTSWRGLAIVSPANLKDIDWNDCLLVISSYGGQESIIEATLSFGIPALVVMKLYDNINSY